MYFVAQTEGKKGGFLVKKAREPLLKA